MPDDHDELEAVLEDIAQSYGEGNDITVEIADVSGADHDGETVYISPDRIEQVAGTADDERTTLQRITNTLSHEVEHVHQSDLKGKQRFVERHEEHGQLAGLIINAVEDKYIDETRLERYPGLRSVHDELNERVMANDEVRPPIDTLDNRAHQLAEGLLQVATTGSVKGRDGIDGDLWDELSAINDRLEDVHDYDDPIEREALAEELYERVVQYADQQDVSHDQLNNAAQSALEDHPDGDDFDQETSTGESELGSDDDTTTSTTNESSNSESADNMSEMDRESAVESDDSDDSGGFLSSVADTLRSAIGRGSDDSSGAEDSDTEDDTFSPFSPSNVADSYFTPGRDDDPIDSFENHMADHLSRMQQQAREEAKQPVTPGDREYSETIGSEVHDSGLAREVEQAFRQLKTRDIEQPARSGQRVNTRAAIRRLSGDRTEKNLYLNRQRAALGDRTIGVALDCSGSMDMVNAKKALYALAIATEAIGDSFVAVGFGGGGPLNHPIGYDRSEQLPLADVRLPTITAPSEQFHLSQLDDVRSGGHTPTPAGIQSAGELLDNATHRESVLFVLTDGRANEPLDSYTLADWESDREIKRAKTESEQLVRKLRRTGTRVIGFDIADDGDHHDADMRDIFGEGRYVNATMNNLADKLVESYRQHVLPR